MDYLEVHNFSGIKLLSLDESKDVLLSLNEISYISIF